MLGVCVSHVCLRQCVNIRSCALNCEQFNQHNAKDINTALTDKACVRKTLFFRSRCVHSFFLNNKQKFCRYFWLPSITNHYIARAIVCVYIYIQIEKNQNKKFRCAQMSTKNGEKERVKKRKTAAWMMEAMRQRTKHRFFLFFRFFCWKILFILIWNNRVLHGILGFRMGSPPVISLLSSILATACTRVRRCCSELWHPTESMR